MEYTFLKEEIESLLLFATVPVYLIILSFLQSKNLKIIDQLKNKKLKKEQKLEILSNRKKLKLKIPFFILIGMMAHVFAYLIFSGSFFRYGYFISITIMYLIYLGIGYGNFYLKGAGVLNDIGPSGWLPGN